MSGNEQNLGGALEGLDQNKRSTLKRLIGSGAFVTPVIVSFAMADLSIDAFMHVAAANITTTHTPAPTTTAAPGPTTTAAPGPTTTTLPPGHPTKS